jgi:tetratricopeptide (TPR) repeat protein
MKNRKALLISLAVAAAAILIYFLITFIMVIPYRVQIPSIPDAKNLSGPLNNQLSVAQRNAYKKPCSENLGLLGLAFHSNSFYDKASVCYSLAIKRKKGDWKWNYYLGYLNQEMGDPRSAIKNYNEVTRIKPDLFLAWYYKGECYQKTGVNDSAEIAFNTIISGMDKNAILKTRERYDYFPLVTYSMYDLARIYMNSGRVEQAEKLLTDIVNYQRAFGPAYRLLGNVYNINGNESLSSQYLVRAGDLTVNPSPVDTLIDRLSLISRSDNYLLKKIDEAEKSIFPEYALKLVNHSMQYFPENKYLVAKAVRLYLIRDMGKVALQYLDKHYNYFKSDFKELKGVGDLLYSKEYYTEAMNYYLQAEKLKPDDGQVQSCIVICLSREGRRDQALNTANSYLSKNKNNPALLADGITLLLDLGETEKAVRWLSVLKSLSPSPAKVKQLTGMLADKGGRWNEALENYYAAFAADPSDLTTVRLLGNLLVRQKLWGKAIAHFRKALEFHPNEPYILERLGTLLVTCTDAGLRDVGQGRYFCERAFINISSHSVTLISAGRSLAIAYALLGDKQNALKVIRMTIDSADEQDVPDSYREDLRNLLNKFNSLS